jgi:hypothetical protein
VTTDENIDPVTCEEVVTTENVLIQTYCFCVGEGPGFPVTCSDFLHLGCSNGGCSACGSVDVGPPYWLSCTTIDSLVSYSNPVIPC